MGFKTRGAFSPRSRVSHQVCCKWADTDFVLSVETLFAVRGCCKEAVAVSLLYPASFFHETWFSLSLSEIGFALGNGFRSYYQWDSSRRTYTGDHLRERDYKYRMFGLSLGIHKRVMGGRLMHSSLLSTPNLCALSAVLKMSTVKAEFLGSCLRSATWCVVRCSSKCPVFLPQQYPSPWET